MMSGFFYVKEHKKYMKLNFQNNKLDITNLIDELCKIGKNKIIHTIENIFLNWFIHECASNLYNHFISETFETTYSIKYLW